MSDSVRDIQGPSARGVRPQRSSIRSTIRSAVLAGLASLVPITAAASTSSISVADNSASTTNAPVVLSFPLTRAGDLSYTASVHYHTVDGTAHFGTDYTADSGTLLLPPGLASASIPVTIASVSGPPEDSTFELQLDAATGVGPTPSFASQLTFPTATLPRVVAIADLNGDGKPDLISANESGGISVLINTTLPGVTTPTFAPQQPFATGMFSIAVVAADINGDGKPDLIVTNYEDKNVSVLINTTTPGALLATFAPQLTFSTGSGPRGVAVADVNGDGLPDLLVANYSDATVSVLLNLTHPGALVPNFAAQQTFAVGALPYAVSVADFNGDGVPDIAVPNAGAGTVSVLLNTTMPGAAAAAFADQQTFAAGSFPRSLTVADVNGDGLPDLIAGNANDATLSVLLNTTEPGAATATFAAQQTFASGTYPIAVFAADLNGDGKPDLIVANNGADSASVLVNTTPPGATTASFAPQQTLAAGTSPQFIGAADLNGDGRSDLVVSNRDDGTISVLPNSTTADGAGTPAFADQQTFATGAFPRSIALADLNGDGRTDLIAGNANDNTLSILLNNTPAGASAPSFADQQLVDTGSYPIAVAVADLNGDGKPDLIAANNSDNTVSLLLNQTAPGAAVPSFAAQQTFATGTGPLFVVACDLNGDGRPDLAVANRDVGSVSVLLNATPPGATTLASTPQQSFTTANFPRYLACTDLNGDGRPDLISANESGGISVLINTTPPGANVPAFAAQQPFATGAFSIAVTAADVNGDGKPDLIVTNYQDLDVSVLLNTTPPGAAIVTFAAQQTFPTGHGPRGVAAVDINGDGRPDLLVANYSDATISVLLNATPAGASAPIFAAQQTFAVGALPYAVGVADFNGDGMSDLAVPNAGAGSVSVLLNAQYAAMIDAGAATGTIVHDYIFRDGFD